eukprot:4503968-Prymnesium_polylepis.2
MRRHQRLVCAAMKPLDRPAVRSGPWTTRGAPRRRNAVEESVDVSNDVRCAHDDGRKRTWLDDDRHAPRRSEGRRSKR